VINQGTIAADVPGGLIRLVSGSFTNTGTWAAQNGATLSIEGVPWHNAGAIVVNNGTVSLGGTFATADIGTISRTNGVINLTGSLNNTAATLSLNASTG